MNKAETVDLSIELLYFLISTCNSNEGNSGNSRYLGYIYSMLGNKDIIKQYPYILKLKRLNVHGTNLSINTSRWPQIHTYFQHSLGVSIIDRTLMHLDEAYLAIESHSSKNSLARILADNEV